jgi:hypothetical protein
MRLIDADALIDYLQIMPIDLGYREVEKIEEYVMSMPTIEPQRKTGEWELVDADKFIFRCGVCKKNTFGMSDWCPKCGAKME